VSNDTISDDTISDDAMSDAMTSDGMMSKGMRAHRRFHGFDLGRVSCTFRSSPVRTARRTCGFATACSWAKLSDAPIAAGGSKSSPTARNGSPSGCPTTTPRRTRSTTLNRPLHGKRSPGDNRFPHTKERMTAGRQVVQRRVGRRRVPNPQNNAHTPKAASSPENVAVNTRRLNPPAPFPRRFPGGFSQPSLLPRGVC